MFRLRLVAMPIDCIHVVDRCFLLKFRIHLAEIFCEHVITQDQFSVFSHRILDRSTYIYRTKINDMFFILTLTFCETKMYTYAMPTYISGVISDARNY